MFKPHYGKCICHPDGQTRLIVVKKGYCQQGNQEQKNKVKAEKKESVSRKVAALFKKIPTVKELVKSLDGVFSIFIRSREADENGITRCVTCGHVDHWRKMDCGHYWSRRIYSLRWDERNCGVQCTECNIFKEGNKPAFTKYLTNKYGAQILETLEMKKNNTFDLKIFTLRFLIKEYTEKIKNIKL